MSMPSRKPQAIDLFCGSGAVTLGLKQAGFEVVGAVDFDAGACKTFKANHPEVKLVQEDIRKICPSLFEEHVKGRLDLLVVCAPCQPFSSQNRKKSILDSRNSLVEESKKFIDHFNPAVVFLENVPGLAATEIFGDFKKWLQEEALYEVSDPMKVDASELGVPQRRSRMILVAVKGISLKEATDIAKVPGKTVGQTIQDLPVPPIGRPSSESSDVLHYARRHSDLNIERLKNIPVDGGGRESLPYHLQLICHRNKKKTSFSDTYGRMSWGKVAPTLTTGCTDITRGRFAHPVQNRAITLREAARLQTFPDSYKFMGNANQIATQIGNAVPPVMMKVIAQSLKKALCKS